MSAALPRPAEVLLRAPLANRTKKHILIALVLGVATSIAYKVGISDPRKRAYKKYYQ